MPTFNTVRGMRDFLPKEAKMLKYVERKARKIARLYRYKEIITPLIESYELLGTKSGEEIRSRMFTFRDHGNRMIALRPEFTTSVARLVSSTLRNEPKPLRLLSVGSVYRYDEPQRGRYREFWQSNYELIGSNKPEADAEIILLTDRLMKEVGLNNFAFKVGHVGVLKGILSQEDIDNKKQNTIFQRMDKEEYDGALQLVTSEKCRKVLLDLVKLKGKKVFDIVEQMKEKVRDYSKAVTAVENLQEILKILKEGKCEIETVDAGFARGLEYYTGIIFEAYIPELNIALGGGGRYDKLIELFGGEPTPAVGVAHGLDRIMLATKLQNAVQKNKEEKIVTVIPIIEELRGEAMKVSQMLRNEGVSTEVEVMGRNITKALEDADRRKIDYAIIIGKKELEKGTVVIRNLKKREQHIVKIERITNTIEGSI